LGLFISDDDVMSDEAIAKALDAPLAIHPQSRVALFNLGHQSSRAWGWAGALSVHPDGMGPEGTLPKMAGALRQAPGISDLVPIPTFVVPPKKELGHLRQAAARVQADLIWVTSSQCLLTEDHPLFAKDKAEALCSAEAVLVDVRTGLIPFSARATQKIRKTKGKGELDFARTRLLAEREAVDAALAENAGRLGTFLADLRGE
jgi:hypothetical protein